METPFADYTEAMADKARLDWLEAQAEKAYFGYIIVGADIETRDCQDDGALPFRQAIDAEMKAEETT